VGEEQKKPCFTRKATIFCMINDNPAWLALTW
jgi:hypothetical protein